jgi:hypothetical protein
MTDRQPFHYGDLVPLERLADLSGLALDRIELIIKKNRIHCRRRGRSIFAEIVSFQAAALRAQQSASTAGYFSRRH